MRIFLLALQFLTVIPIKIKNLKEKEMSWSLIFFPIIGAILGAVLVIFEKILCLWGFPDFALSVILVISLIIFTAGLHLDGLSDTADAFLSGRNREGKLKIMRDPHAGIMGILAVLSIILLKISLLMSFGLIKPIVLFLMCVLSRYSLVLAIFLFPYARQEGKAMVFFEGINGKIFLAAAVIALSLVIFAWSVKGLLVFLLVCASTYIIARFIAKRIGGMTGDTLGAILEINEALILVGCFFISKI